MTGNWLELCGDPDATGYVVCLPYAGGAGRAFRPWRTRLPPGWALALADLPGHGRRIGEQCHRGAEPVVAGLLQSMSELPSSRVVVLGYSLGGWLAYELAHRLVAAATPPMGLIACMSRAPQTGMGHPPLSHLDRGRPFLDRAVELGLAQPEMLAVPELARSFADGLQADLQIVETYRYRTRVRLDIPVCVIGADGDWLVPEPALRGWDALCRRPPLHLRVAGDHMAIHDRSDERPDPVGGAVRTALHHLLAHAGAAAPAGSGGAS